MVESEVERVENNGKEQTNVTIKHLVTVKPPCSVNESTIYGGITGMDKHAESNKKDCSSLDPSWATNHSRGGGGDESGSQSFILNKSVGGEERWVKTLAQVIGPLFIAGFGMVGAGIFLDIVLKWPVFKSIPQFVVVITPLLGLKGNLEMTVASRHCTYANLGYMDTPRQSLHIFAGDLTLTQVQSTVVGFFASIVAILLNWITSAGISFMDATILCSCCMLTAAAASVILGSIMMGVVLVAVKFKVNPDNVATPIAASLGDTLTLFLLAWIGSFVFEQSYETKLWLPWVIMGGLVLLLPVWFTICYRNEFTRSVVINGWPPILIAMVISSGAGMILGEFHQKLLGIELYQPVMNGVGGNLVSIQASRICTKLHGQCELGKLPSTNGSSDNNNGDKGGLVCVSPWTTFFKSGLDSTIARVLLVIVIPEHLIFVTVTHYAAMIYGQDSQYSVLFLSIYIGAALIQVALLLHISQILINIFWSFKLDPDVYTIPFVTSLGDLFGTSLLLATYQLLSLF